MSGPHTPTYTSFMIFSSSSTFTYLKKFRSDVHLYKTSPLKKKPLAKCLIVFFGFHWNFQDIRVFARNSWCLGTTTYLFCFHSVTIAMLVPKLNLQGSNASVYNIWKHWGQIPKESVNSLQSVGMYRKLMDLNLLLISSTHYLYGRSLRSEFSIHLKFAE